MYTKVMRYHTEDNVWYGYFQEMPEYKTSAEDGSLKGCCHWLDLLLADLQAWASNGVIPALPRPTHSENTVYMIVDFGANG